MFDRPTCSAETALEQAGMTAHQYLGQAIKSIEFWFGKGYAEKHPELVCAMIKCEVQDFNCVAYQVAMYHISDNLEQISLALDKLTP